MDNSQNNLQKIEDEITKDLNELFGIFPELSNILGSAPELKKDGIIIKDDIIEVTKDSFQFNVKNSEIRRLWDAIVHAEWEEDTFKILNRFVKKGQTYLDVGAWIGPTVLYAAQKAGKLYAIEPDRVAYNELIENVNLNPDLKDKIQCLNIALTAKNEHLKLHIKDNEGDSMSSLLSISNSKQHIEIEGRTIEYIVNELGIDKVDFIKIDIEGGEYFLLPAMKDFLSKSAPTIYVSFHPPFLSEHIQNNSLSENLPDLTSNLLTSLDFYEYIYDSKGNIITKDQILNNEKFHSVVFTNEKW